MSWHYSQEPEAGFSVLHYLDGLRLERLKSKSTPETFCFKDSETGCLTTSQSGMTSAPSTASLGGVQLTFSLGGSPAKTYPQRVKVQDLPEPVQDFGKSTHESLTKCGLSLSSPKTVRSYEPVDSAPFSKTLTNWGMTHDGGCWGLGTSVRITDGTECGYLDTPTAMAKSGQWPTPKASDGEKGTRTTEGAVKSVTEGPEGLRGMCKGLAHPDSERLEGRHGENTSRTWVEERPITGRSKPWEFEPNVGRVANGVASRVDRLKAIGNGQVPSVAATAFRILSRGL
jgi:hypothetical protein